MLVSSTDVLIVVAMIHVILARHGGQMSFFCQLTFKLASEVDKGSSHLCCLCLLVNQLHLSALLQLMLLAHHLVEFVDDCAIILAKSFLEARGSFYNVKLLLIIVFVAVLHG